MKPELLLVFTAMLWSVGGLFIKLISLSAFGVAGWRSLFAAVTLTAFYRKLPRLRTSVEYAAALVYAATVISFVMATKMSTAANAIFLQSTAPLYVGIAGALWLGEKLSSKDALSFVGVALGMSLFFAGHLSAASLVGNLVGALSGVFFALFILCMRKASSKTPVEVIVWGNILAAVIAIPLATDSLPRGQNLWGLLFLGAFQLALPYFLYSKAITKVRAFDASLIFLLEPVLNPIWVYWVTGEKPALWSLVGGFIVLLSIGLRGLAKPSKALPPPD